MGTNFYRRKLIALTGVLLFLSALILTYSRLTDGFSIRQITPSKRSSFVYIPKQIPDLQTEELSAILEQPFYYVDKGCQFYVFESQDQKYVLKFFKQKHLRLSPFSEFFNYKVVSRLYPSQVQKKTHKLNQLIYSCELAGTKIADQTGVIYLHLNSKPICHQKVTLINKLGVKHTIDLHQYDFAIQKKATDAIRFFSSLDLQKDQRVAKQAIYQIIDLYRSRCLSEVGDHDFASLQNLGYLYEEQKFQILDFGQLKESSELKDSKQMHEDILHRLRDMQVWSQKHLPGLTLIVEEVIDEFCLSQ